MYGQIRGRGSFSDDEEDPPLRTASPRSDEDEFARSSQENESRRFPPRVSIEEDSASPPKEEDTPRSSCCSPLAHSFAQTLSLSAHGSSSSPPTPLRAVPAKPLCQSQDFIFTKNGLAAASEIQTVFQPEFLGLTQTPASRKHRDARTPFSGSSKRTPKGEGQRGSRLAVPARETPHRRPESRKKSSPKHRLSDLAAWAFAVKPQTVDFEPPGDDFDLLGDSLFSREASPPRARSVVSRRLSLGEKHQELAPSPVRKSWPGPYERSSRETEPVNFFREISSPLPLRESTRPHGPIGTPNEPKTLVAPGRPKKRCTMPSTCSRSLLNSPLPASAAATTPVDEIPDLDIEARPMMISNAGSDSNRSNKIVRRHSHIERRDLARLESPERGVQKPFVSSPGLSPNLLGRRSRSDPFPYRKLSDSSSYPPLAKQSEEQKRVERARCRVLTSALLRIGTKLLCVDWDLTAVGLHTQSRWHGTEEQLAQWIRPAFRNLVREALRNNIRVAFVSFSGQTSSIVGAVRCEFGEDDRVMVRCSDKLWDVEDQEFAAMFPHAKQCDTSKLGHICSAATMFTRRASTLSDKENSNPQTLHISPDNVVFIDDDMDNIVDAGRHHVRCVHMDPNEPDRFLDRLEEMCGINPTAPPLSLHMMD